MRSSRRVVTGLVYILILTFAWSGYQPHTSYISAGFTSDTAIPVLMSNYPSENLLFDMYYWRQDRFGAWPFLIIRNVTQPVEDSHLFLFMFILLHTSVLFLSLQLSRNAVQTVTYITAFSLPLHCLQSIGGLIFDTAQPYGWQLSTLFFAAGFFVKERHLLHESAGAFFAFLSVWMNPVSVIILAGLRGVQWYTGKRRLLRLIALQIPVALSFLAHSSLQQLYQGSFDSVRTPTGLLLNLWPEMIIKVLKMHTGFFEWLFWIPPLLLILAVLFRRRLFTRNFARNSVPVLAGFASAGFLLFAVTPAIEWVIMNEAGARYFVIPRYLILTTSLFIVMRTVCSLVSESMQQVVVLITAIPLVLIAYSHNSEPVQSYADRKQTARALQSEYPGLPIIGEYWNTYVYTALQDHTKPVNISVPGRGSYNRNPFWNVQEAGKILVHPVNIDPVYDRAGRMFINGSFFIKINDIKNDKMPGAPWELWNRAVTDDQFE